MNPIALMIAAMILITSMGSAGVSARPGGLSEDGASGRLEVATLGGEKPSETLELPLQHTDVNIEVSGFVALATVTQTYTNPYEEPIEAVYSFPLPDDAAVDAMVMRIGERTIRAVIERREAARKRYEAARDAGQRASLLEQERPNLFTQSVANIMPGDDIRISIRYVNVLKYAEGAYALAFPMVVGPRYIPGAGAGRGGTGWSPDTDQVPDASRITPPVLKPGERSGHDIALKVELDAGVPIRGLHSVSHRIAVEEQGAAQRVIRLHPSDTIPNKDFVLRYEVAGEAPQMAVITHHDERGGFFTLLVQPQRQVADDETVPRELIFILDTSGSMRGFPLAKSKEAMRRLIAGMRPGDTFNVVRFAGDSGTLWSAPKPYNATNARAALAFVESLRGHGGTEMRRGIVTALAQPAGPGMLRIAFLLTDGHIGNEQAILAAIEKERRGARVFSLGVGSSVNRYLLDRAATVGRGEAFYVRQDEDSRGVIDAFFKRVDRPALAHIEIDWGGLDVAESYPSRVPDLWAGQPIRLHGRYSQGGRGEVRITGQLGREQYAQSISVELPRDQPANEAMASVWAREKVRTLMLRMAKAGQTDALVAAITELGLAFKILTQWTSFVAVEEQVVNEGGTQRTVVQPVELPEGTSYEGVFGPEKERLAASLSSPALRQRIGSPVRSAAPPASTSFGVAAQSTAEVRPTAPLGDVRPKAGESHAPMRFEKAPPPQPAYTADCQIDALAVSGGLKYTQVDQLLEGMREALCELYRGRLKAQSGLSGKILVKLMVTSEGEVAEAKFKTEGLDDKALIEDLEKVLKRLRFEAVDSGRVTFWLRLERHRAESRGGLTPF